MRHVISAMLVFVGVIHLLPLSGALGSKRLATLYGLSFSEPNVAILMRHRAVLFGLLGSLLIYAAFHVPTQPIAFVGGFVSVLSYLWIARSVGGYNAQLGRVFSADIVALICLVVGAVSYVLDGRT